MATFEVTAPDGNVYEVNAPDDATDAQIQSYVVQNMQPTEQAPAHQQPIASQDSPSGFVQGALDPVYGLSQGLESVLPESWSENINQFNDYLIDEYGAPLERMGTGGADEQVRRREAEYLAAREAAGEEGTDWARIGGNIASTAIPVAGVAGKVAGAAPRLAMGTAGGGASALAMPAVGEGDYSKEKLKQFLWGSIGGLGGTGATIGAGKFLAPYVDDAVKMLKESGIPMTVGQRAGGLAKAAEEKARSIPLAGDVISAQHKTGLKAFSDEVYNKSLGHLGLKLPSGVSGRDAAQYVTKAYDDAYNAVLPRITGEIDDQMFGELDNLTKLSKNLPDDLVDEFRRVVDDEILGKFTDYGKASGETLNDIHSTLGQLSKGYKIAKSPSERQFGKAIEEAQAVVKRMVERQSPEASADLAKIRAGYGDFKTVQNAATRAGSKEGDITPAALRAASKATDIGKDKSQFFQGKGRMQDFAEAGEKVLAQSIPNSGTADRLMLAGLTGAGSMLSPTVGTMLGAASLLGTKPAQKMLGTLLFDRPELVRQFGGLLGDFSGSAGAGVGGASGR